MPATLSTDPYEVLGISVGASQDEVRAAWLRAAKRYHPDAGGDAWMFRLAKTSYEILSTGGPGPSAPPPPEPQSYQSYHQPPSDAPEPEPETEAQDDVHGKPAGQRLGPARFAKVAKMVLALAWAVAYVPAGGLAHVLGWRTWRWVKTTPVAALAGLASGVVAEDFVGVGAVTFGVLVLCATWWALAGARCASAQLGRARECRRQRRP